MTKDEFIGKYLDREMKGHSLPFGMEYYNLLGEKTEKAEMAWVRHQIIHLKRQAPINLRKRVKRN